MNKLPALPIVPVTVKVYLRQPEVIVIDQLAKQYRTSRSGYIANLVRRQLKEEAKDA